MGAERVLVRPYLSRINEKWEVHKGSSFDIEGDYIVIHYAGRMQNSSAPREIKGTYELIDNNAQK